MRRRELITGMGAALAAPHLAYAQTARTLRFVPYTDLPVLDPNFVNNFAARTHAFLGRVDGIPDMHF